ncbi:MAG: transglutaminase domain-containing protein [Fulvivirga sp.]
MRYVLPIILCLVIKLGFAQNNPNNFQKADSVAKVYLGFSLNNLPQLASNLTSFSNDEVERYRAIFTWVCENIEADIPNYRINNRKRNRFKNDTSKLEEWNSEFSKIVFKRLLEDKKTVCMGYSYLIMQLCYLANIKAEIVDGYGRSTTSIYDGFGLPNHSWNSVYLKGRWYLSDPTWSSGDINSENSEFYQKYNDGYFLVEPTEFSYTHYPLDKKWLLNDSSLTFSEFQERPLVYKNAFKKSIFPKEPNLFNRVIEKGESIEFIFKSKSVKNLQNISLEIIKGSTIKLIDNYEVLDESHFKFNYHFTSKGKYDIHLKVDDTYISTFAVTAR